MSRPTREQVAQALEQEFGAFLAHDPHNPERFWTSTARAVLALFPEPSTAAAEAEADARYNRGDLSVGEYLFARDAFVAGAAWQAQQPREVVTTAADAWDEGWDAGTHLTCCGSDLAANPYRSDRPEGETP